MKDRHTGMRINSIDTDIRIRSIATACIIVTTACVDPISFEPSSVSGEFVFFEVSGQHIARIYTLPSMIEGNQIVETCPVRRSEIIEDKCCFCWLLDESENRIESPDYW